MAQSLPAAAPFVVPVSRPVPGRDNERLAAVACEPFQVEPYRVDFQAHSTSSSATFAESRGRERLPPYSRAAATDFSSRLRKKHRSQRTVFPSTKSAVNVICGTAPQGLGERQKQQVIKSRTKSSRGAARGRASPLSGEPGTRVRAIRADRWRPEGQRASNGRRASRGSDRHTRRRDSIHG